MIIYKITNTITRLSYIGQTTLPIRVRWNKHLHSARKGVDAPLYRAMNECGVRNFIIEIIDTATSIDELNQKEKYYVKLYSTCSEGYNITKGGGNYKHSRGRTMSCEQREVLSQRTKDYYKNKRSKYVETRNAWIFSTYMKHKVYNPVTKLPFDAVDELLSFYASPFDVIYKVAVECFQSHIASYGSAPDSITMGEKVKAILLPYCNSASLLLSTSKSTPRASPVTRKERISACLF